MGFERHYQNIKSASIEAKRCFEEKEWEKIERDSKLRLNFYDEQGNDFCKKLSLELKKQPLYGAKAEFNESQNSNKFNSDFWKNTKSCLLYTSPSPRDGLLSRMPSSA